MKKFFLIIPIFLLNTFPVSATDCYAGGNGVCSDSASCDSTTSDWRSIYSPVNVCLGSGNGCCVLKLPSGRVCLTGGAYGVCSDSASCDSTTSDWSTVYSPVNFCVGYGNGCCTPKASLPILLPTPFGSGSTANASGDCGDLSVNTALGCFAAGDPKKAISQILGWAIVVGGGVAFLTTIYAGFQISTAQGDPKKMQAANELLTSAISGLILIIFSVVILNVIGVSVLGLDKFGFNL